MSATRRLRLVDDCREQAGGEVVDIRTDVPDDPAPARDDSLLAHFEAAIRRAREAREDTAPAKCHSFLSDHAPTCDCEDRCECGARP